MTKAEAKKRYKQFMHDLNEFIDEYESLPGELNENQLLESEFNVMAFWSCMKSVAIAIKADNPSTVLKLQLMYHELRDSEEKNNA